MLFGLNAKSGSAVGKNLRLPNRVSYHVSCVSPSSLYTEFESGLKGERSLESPEAGLDSVLILTGFI